MPEALQKCPTNMKSVQYMQNYAKSRKSSPTIQTIKEKAKLYISIFLKQHKKYAKVCKSCKCKQSMQIFAKITKSIKMYDVKKYAHLWYPVTPL